MRCISHSLTVLIALLLYTYPACCRPQVADTDTSKPEPHLAGRYVPELHGAHLGKYVPDDSGQYHHIKVPYDGGYGDRGMAYLHDDRALPPPPQRPPQRGGLNLGLRDHLRFAVDFNYDGSGWQIVQFEWMNDDDDTKHYEYKNRNQLLSAGRAKTNDGANSYGGNTSAAYGVPVSDQKNTNVHLSGEYKGNIYNVNYTNDNAQQAPSQKNIQSTIREVLDYIQVNVLPTLS